MSYIGSKPADKALTSDDITDGVISTAKIQDNAVTTAKTSYSDAPFRNIIINGDMSIAQRGTSATGLGNGDSGYHTVDRFRFEEGGSPTAEFTMTQSTDVPTGQGFGYSTKFDCTTAQGSLASSDIIRFATFLEGQNLQQLKKGTSNAESLTLSFWVKSNKTGTYTLRLEDVDNARMICSSYTISASATWEKKTITFDGDTTGTLDNDNGLSFLVRFNLLAGTNYDTGTLQTTWGSTTDGNSAVGQVNLADNTANDWYITGVQLEAGTTASDFEFLPYDVNLRRCLRYYYTYVDGVDQSIGIGVGYNNNLVYVHVNFPVEMRTAPSLISSNNTNDFRSRKANIDPFDSWDGVQTFTKYQNIPYSSAQVSISTGEAVWVETNNATALLAFNSEL